MADDRKRTDRKRTGPQQEASVAGPGSIAGQQAGRTDRGLGADAAGIASGREPDEAGGGTSGSARAVAGTPGSGTGMANPARDQDVTSGMSGGATNDAAPFGGRTDNPRQDATPPDTVENPPRRVRDTKQGRGTKQG